MQMIFNALGVRHIIPYIIVIHVHNVFIIRTFGNGCGGYCLASEVGKLEEV